MIEALEISDLAVRRGGRQLFAGLSLKLAPGEACAVTGANGAGKTSLLRTIAGLLAPDAGTIGFGGEDVAVARAGGLHFMGHLDGLKPARTAGEELDFWTRWEGASTAGAAGAIDALALKALLPLEVRRLSAGQRRRLALGRLLASPRRLWLLDEPFSPLDAQWRTRLGQIMATHLAGGGMILAAVHDPMPIPARTLEIAG